MLMLISRFVLWICLAVSCDASLLLAGGRTAYLADIDGTINPSTSEFVHSSIERARASGAVCIIFRLNTPGGLLKSTRVIVSDFLASPVPVIVYVSPGGAQAASAGVFITLAAHVAVMAPGTNIGAAHPVTVGEQMDSVMASKVTNDAAAFIRTISEKRQRNVAWAEDAVRKSLSITESEALRNHVIDTVAATVEDLLAAIDGRRVDTGDGPVTLETRHAAVVLIERSFQEKMLDLLSDPNIAYIFMMLGIYGLLFELYNPGSILPGIVGFICLILAFYSFHTLPVNYAGVALIVFSVILFVLDVKLTSHGLLTVGGVVSLVLGSMMLIRTESVFDVISLSWTVIAVVAVFTALFFIVAVGMGIRAQRRKPTTGSEGLIGSSGEALTDLAPEGQIRLHGEIWNAVSEEGTIEKQATVVVRDVRNLTVVVTPTEGHSQ